MAHLRSLVSVPGYVHVYLEMNRFKASALLFFHEHIRLELPWLRKRRDVKGHQSEVARIHLCICFVCDLCSPLPVYRGFVLRVSLIFGISSQKIRQPPPQRSEKKAVSAAPTKTKRRRVRLASCGCEVSCSFRFSLQPARSVGFQAPLLLFVSFFVSFLFCFLFYFLGSECARQMGATSGACVTRRTEESDDLKL